MSSLFRSRVWGGSPRAGRLGSHSFQGSPDGHWIMDFLAKKKLAKIIVVLLIFCKLLLAESPPFKARWLIRSRPRAEKYFQFFPWISARYWLGRYLVCMVWLLSWLPPPGWRSIRLKLSFLSLFFVYHHCHIPADAILVILKPKLLSFRFLVIIIATYCLVQVCSNKLSRCFAHIMIATTWLA